MCRMPDDSDRIGTCMGKRALHIETPSAMGVGSAKYLIPPPIVPQLGRLPTEHASANATKYLNTRAIVFIDLLRCAVRWRKQITGW